MNRREAKIKALGMAWRLLDGFLRNDTELLADSGMTDADIAKVERELDAIAQRLYERHQDLSSWRPCKRMTT